MSLNAVVTRGILFRSVALRRIAPSMEDSKEGKSIDCECISQHTVIS